MSNEIEKRYIRAKLKETADNIAQDSQKRMVGFRSQFWNQRSFAVTDSVMTYNHLKQHRFVDMKTRKIDNTPKRKKSHAIHNKIVMGNYKDLTNQLAYGFTEEVKKKFRELQADNL